MSPRILIVAEHASAKLGGEAIIPLHYYRILRQRKIPVWLIVHERTRDELDRLFPEDRHIRYISDTVLHQFLWKLGGIFPARLAFFTTGLVMRLATQIEQRKIARHLIATENIDIVHQPIPVSPKEPSMLFHLGAPVIIGPMNGGMVYPPAFGKMQAKWVTHTLSLGRLASGFANQIIPGKMRAAQLLVANKRTHRALPFHPSRQPIQLVENGVNLSLWQGTKKSTQISTSGVVHYIFLGRLVDWKAVNLLIEAFQHAAQQVPISLSIIGDGPERDRLENQAESLGILGRKAGEANQVFFWGWMAQEDCVAQLSNADALLLPSLLECGGAVVLEAMALGLPVIATRWGGPEDYLDDSCGIMIDPLGHEQFVADFAAAMAYLANHPEKRKMMGQAGLEKVKKCFDWEVKVDQILEIYNMILTQKTSQ